MKFLADMGISPKTVAFLHDLGHEAAHLHELGLHRLPDSAVLEKARLEGCILLTHDLDFAELVAASGARLPSVIIFRLVSMDPERVSSRLARVIFDHQDALDRGAIISITEAQVRVRLLPLRIKEW